MLDALCEMLWKATLPPAVLRQAAILHVAAMRAAAQEDQGIGGVRFGPLASTLRAQAPGAQLGALLRATALGAEVGGRVGLALQQAGGQAEEAATATAATAAATAAAIAALEGQDAATASAEIAAAAPEAGGLPLSLSGAGERWLIGGALIGRGPVAPGFRVLTEGVREILRRHVRAAEKRLRADQVERIEVRGPAGLVAACGLDGRHGGSGLAAGPLTAAGVLGSAGGTLGVLLARNQVEAPDLTPDALAEKEADIRHVAGTLEVIHDWSLTVRAARARAAALGGLYGSRRAALVRLARRAEIPAAALPELLPGLLSEVAAGFAGDVAYTLARPGMPDPDRYRWEVPIIVRLYTTRGGWWPERRAVPEGMGGTAAERAAAALESALLRYPEDQRARIGGMVELTGDALSGEAADWLEGLWC